MSPDYQYIIAGAIVALAAIGLWKNFSASKDHGGCGDCPLKSDCGKLSSDAPCEKKHKNACKNKK